MSYRLTVIFYIVLCLEVGAVLTLLPWIHPFGLSDWSDNYFLLYAAQKTGLYGLQQAVSSGWVRGAVTGLGLLNLGIAFWEMAHFNQTVRIMQKNAGASPIATAAAGATHTDAAFASNAAQTQQPDPLPNYERSDDAGHGSFR